MTGSQWLVVAIGAGVLALPAWSCVRCLIQTRRLLRWRRPSIQGLDGQPAALRGDVRVSDPVNAWTLGDCLWHRHVTQVHTVGSRGTVTTTTQADISSKAVFSIVVEGIDFFVNDLPTKVYGAHYRKTFGGSSSFISTWLPVVDHLTVVGRVRQEGSRWEIVKDASVGFIWSTHPAEATAFRELVKAGLCLAIVAAGALAFWFILDGVR